MSRAITASSRVRSGGPSLFGIAGRALTAVQVAWQVRRERNQLAALNDSALKDLGLSRADVDGEADRPLWDIPTDRLR